MPSSPDHNLIKIKPEDVVDELYGPPKSEGQRKLDEFKEKGLPKPEKASSVSELPPNLAEQYESQKEILNKLGILKELSTGEPGIIGIDNQEYPFPTQEQISQRISEKQELIERKQEQGFTRLLLVPFGSKLNDLIEVYKKTILDHHKNHKLFATKKKPTDPDEPLQLDENQPVRIWDQYRHTDQEGKLVYHPKEFSKDSHQGKTKQELLQEDPNNAWQVILIEDMPNIPRGGKGKTIANRKQPEAGQTPNEYLNMLQTNLTYQGEQGMTPEDQLIYAVSHLEETNQVIDDYQGHGSISYQLGAWFPGSGRVPAAFWLRVLRRATLARGDSGYRDVNCGVRPAVRV